METRTYTIPTPRIDELVKKLTSYQKKANRYGCQLTWQIGEEHPVRRNYLRQGDSRPIDYEMVACKDVSIESDLIVKEGYQVVAKIERSLPGMNRVVAYGNSDPDRSWFSHGIMCQHCNSRHANVRAYIVRHADGHEMMVGSTCLKDYCGIDPAHAAALEKLEDVIVDEYDVSGSWADETMLKMAACYDIEEAIALACDVIARYGYVASSETNSTKSRLHKCLQDHEVPTAASLETAKELVEWLKNEDAAEVSSVLWNVRICAIGGYCTVKDIGRVAYAPVSYKKEMEKAERRKQMEAQKQQEADASQYLGEVGKRMDFEIAKAVLLTSWDTAYGTTYLYKMNDTAGNVLIWFASAPLHTYEIDHVGGYKYVPFEHGRIRATVKDHSERDGVKQTVITRGKIINTELRKGA